MPKIQQKQSKNLHISYTHFILYTFLIAVKPTKVVKVQNIA